MYCTNCGQRESEDANFCSRCGRSLAKVSSDPTGQSSDFTTPNNEPVARKNGMSTYGPLVALVVISIGAVVAAFLYFSDSTGQSANPTVSETASPTSAPFSEIEAERLSDGSTGLDLYDPTYLDPDELVAPDPVNGVDVAELPFGNRGTTAYDIGKSNGLEFIYAPLVVAQSEFELPADAYGFCKYVLDTYMALAGGSSTRQQYADFLLGCRDAVDEAYS